MKRSEINPVPGARPNYIADSEGYHVGCGGRSLACGFHIGFMRGSPVAFASASSGNHRLRLPRLSG